MVVEVGGCGVCVGYFISVDSVLFHVDNTLTSGGHEDIVWLQVPFGM